MSGSNEYPNIKARLQFLLADYINKGLIYIESKLTEEIKNIIADELMVMKLIDKDGKLACESKDKMITILGHSPDFVDAIMYRLYFILTRHK
jgi:hypothetical protein